MKIENNSPIDRYDSVQYKLDAYFDDLGETSYRKDYIDDKLNKIDNNLTVFKRKGIYHIKQKRVYCPYCSSKEINENGHYPKKIIHEHNGKIDCKIKRYECKKCHKGFSADISSFVRKNFSVTEGLIKIIQDYYSIGFISVRKIQEIMKNMHNITISHQEVQDILVDYYVHFNPDIKEYSGRYAFDALWIKIDELGDKWVFLLTLVDTSHNTVVAYKIVEEETEEEVYKFLREATLNQPRKGITTDLKKEYRRPIDKLGFEHQFCLFHFKKTINRKIRKYAKKHNLTGEKIKEIKSFLPELYSVFQLENMDEVQKKFDNLRKDIKKFPQIIQDILNENFLPYGKNLTKFIANSDIEPTTNSIERIFEDLSPKYIKKKFKTVRGFLSRFNLKLKRWDSRNAIY